MNYRLPLVLVLTITLSCAWAQKEANWSFKYNYQKRVSVPFKLVNNLMVISLTVNGSNPLNFIVDTGLKNTIITELSYGDSLMLVDAEETSLRGLGGSHAIPALITHKNTIRIGNIVGENQNILVMMDNVFHLSEKFGMRIHGIIGYELFKNFVVELNYIAKRIRFNSSPHFNYKKCKKYTVFRLMWYRHKPYIDIQAKVEPTQELVNMHMLLDTGSSDAAWIFNESHPSIEVPQKKVRSYLGSGLSGEVHGYRARIAMLCLGKYQLESPVCAFPDSIELSHVLNYPKRNGSIGGNVLKRFKIIFDYPRSTVYLRKNARFREPFYFNATGIEISTPFPGLSVFLISEIRENSPAEEAGLKAGDQITYLNHKSVNNFNLEDVMSLLMQNKKEYLSIRIVRKGKKLTFRLHLDSQL